MWLQAIDQIARKTRIDNNLPLDGHSFGVEEFDAIIKHYDEKVPKTAAGQERWIRERKYGAYSMLASAAEVVALGAGERVGRRVSSTGQARKGGARVAGADAAEAEASLTRRFGEAMPPGGKTPIKYFEHVNGKVIKNPDLHVIRPGDKIPTLDPKKNWIWVVDKKGNLRIGSEVPVKIDPETGKWLKLGHPTLTDGAPARIGGELRFGQNGPFINSWSGRYSKPYSRTSGHLDNAAQLFRDAGLPVQVH
jgi:hypothetical protein